MYLISKDENNVVTNVYNSEYHVDDVETFQISEEDKNKIIDSGILGLWAYDNGKIVESIFYNEILKNEFNKKQKQFRQMAYEKESDPIFMKYQRGEATKEEWEAKIAEIVARFPYQE